VAYWWDAGIFAFGAVLAALLFRRRGQAAQTPAPATEPSTDNELVAVH
jgi:uncharacterized protein YehS (DUF1456 family)